jgi:hypothetical protein
VKKRQFACCFWEEKRREERIWEEKRKEMKNLSCEVRFENGGGEV